MEFTLSELNALYVATGRYAKQSKTDAKNYGGTYFEKLSNEAEALHDNIGKELSKRLFGIEQVIDNING
jgi:hypothetical protein